MLHGRKKIYTLLFCILAITITLLWHERKSALIPIEKIKIKENPSKNCTIQQCHPEVGNISCGKRPEMMTCTMNLTTGDICAGESVRCIATENGCVLTGEKEFNSCMKKFERKEKIENLKIGF